MAETTFGRRAVSDLTASWCTGCVRASASPSTPDRIQAYIAASMPGGVTFAARPPEVPPEKRDPAAISGFRNRQKYLLFVHTCSESG
jgi:hypothetical protein